MDRPSCKRDEGINYSQMILSGIPERVEEPRNELSLF